MDLDLSIFVNSRHSESMDMKILRLVLILQKKMFFPSLKGFAFEVSEWKLGHFRAPGLNVIFFL